MSSLTPGQMLAYVALQRELHTLKKTGKISQSAHRKLKELLIKLVNKPRAHCSLASLSLARSPGGGRNLRGAIGAVSVHQVEDGVSVSDSLAETVATRLTTVTDAVGFYDGDSDCRSFDTQRSYWEPGQNLEDEISDDEEECFDASELILLEEQGGETSRMCKKARSGALKSDRFDGVQIMSLGVRAPGTTTMTTTASSLKSLTTRQNPTKGDVCNNIT